MVRCGLPARPSRNRVRRSMHGRSANYYVELGFHKLIIGRTVGTYGDPNTGADGGDDLRMAGGVGSVKSISVDRLAVLDWMCINKQDRCDLSFSPVQRVEGKEEAKHLIRPTQPHKHLGCLAPPCCRAPGLLLPSYLYLISAPSIDLPFPFLALITSSGSQID
jgi:hypothetical protein